MKKTILSLLLPINLAGSVFAQTTYPSGVTGCIARWTFDAPDQPFLTTIPDLSGNGNSGTPHAVATSPGFRNIPFRAGAFDGSTSWGEVGHNAMLNPSNISIISLIKFNHFYSGDCQGNNIVYKGFDYFSDVSWSMSVVESDANCSAINHATEKLYFTGTGISPYTLTLNNFIDSNKWYFLATTFNGSMINFFQIEMDTSIKATNITPLYSMANPHLLGSTMHNVFIGVTQNPPFKYWFNGAMDELILFNKALTNAEVQSVYDYLWGWATGVDGVVKAEDQISFIWNDQTLSVQSAGDAKIKQIEFFDLSGRLLSISKTQFDRIVLEKSRAQILIAKITMTNNLVISKKILNR